MKKTTKPGMAFEEKAYNWVKATKDSSATREGGMDSTTSDIISPMFGVIEVKDIPAQCGQFTLDTADNYSFSNEIMSAVFDNNKCYDNELCKKWVKNYYKNQKHVSYFCVERNNQLELMPVDDFFNNYSFFCTLRGKFSGSRNCPKYADKMLPSNWNCHRIRTKLYSSSIGESCIIKNTKNDNVRIWVNEEGEVRLLSNTKNATYIFSVKER